MMMRVPYNNIWPFLPRIRFSEEARGGIHSGSRCHTCVPYLIRRTSVVGRFGRSKYIMAAVLECPSDGVWVWVGGHRQLTRVRLPGQRGRVRRYNCRSCTLSFYVLKVKGATVFFSFFFPVVVRFRGGCSQCSSLLAVDGHGRRVSVVIGMFCLP